MTEETSIEEEKVEYVDHQEGEMPYLSDDVLITQENFHEYFFEVKNNKPKKGQVLAKYSAMAELIKGEDKRVLIQMLTMPDKALAVAKYMQKVLLATEKESYRVPAEIAADLLAGLSEKKVVNKIYKFQIEAFFYTWPECVPQDGHWQCISLKNLDTFLNKMVEQAVAASKEEAMDQLVVSTPELDANS